MPMQAINDRIMRSHAGGSRCRLCSTYSRHAQQNRNMKVTQIWQKLDVWQDRERQRTQRPGQAGKK